MARTVTANGAEGAMDLYDAEPAGSARGAVIVIQEAFGVTDHIEDVSRRFAAAGYRAVAPHLFHRTGDPVIAYDDMQSVMPQLGGLTTEGLPVGVQIVGPQYGDRSCIAFAKLLEQEFRAFVPPPGYATA